MLLFHFGRQVYFSPRVFKSNLLAKSNLIKMIYCILSVPPSDKLKLKQLFAEVVFTVYFLDGLLSSGCVHCYCSCLRIAMQIVLIGDRVLVALLHAWIWQTLLVALLLAWLWHTWLVALLYACIWQTLLVALFHKYDIPCLISWMLQTFIVVALFLE